MWDFPFSVPSSFYCSTKSMEYHNFFQNKNNTRATYSFAPENWNLLMAPENWQALDYIEALGAAKQPFSVNWFLRRNLPWVYFLKIGVYMGYPPKQKACPTRNSNSSVTVDYMNCIPASTESRSSSPSSVSVESTKSLRNSLSGNELRLSPFEDNSERIIT